MPSPLDLGLAADLAARDASVPRLGTATPLGERVMGHVQHGHSAEIYAILAAERRGPRYPAAGQRLDAHPVARRPPTGTRIPPEGPVSALAQASTPVPTAHRPQRADGLQERGLPVPVG
jgi:hypothetical protein